MFALHAAPKKLQKSFPMRQNIAARHFNAQLAATSPTRSDFLRSNCVASLTSASITPGLGFAQSRITSRILRCGLFAFWRSARGTFPWRISRVREAYAFGPRRLDRPRRLKPRINTTVGPLWTALSDTPCIILVDSLASMIHGASAEAEAQQKTRSESERRRQTSLKALTATKATYNLSSCA